MNSIHLRENILVLTELVEVSRENGLIFRERSEDVALITSGAKKLVRSRDFIFQRRNERGFLLKFFLI